MIPVHEDRGEENASDLGGVMASEVDRTALFGLRDAAPLQDASAAGAARRVRIQARVRVRVRVRWQGHQPPRPPPPQADMVIDV